ncbi:putative holin-like toxin [uncultured Robinsoniella sp.]
MIGGGAMTTYQVLTLMLLFGGFLLTLLGYIDKKK